MIAQVIVFILLALVCLAAGTVGYLGLWRRWTGADGDRPLLLGVFWMSVGFVIGAVSEAVPDGVAMRFTIVFALVVIMLGACFTYVIPPVPHAPLAAIAARAW